MRINDLQSESTTIAKTNKDASNYLLLYLQIVLMML